MLLLNKGKGKDGSASHLRMSSTAFGKMMSLGDKHGFLSSAQIDFKKFQDTLQKNKEFSEERSRIEKFKLLSDRGLAMNYNKDSIYISANSGDEEEIVASKRDSIIDRSPNLSKSHSVNQPLHKVSHQRKTRKLDESKSVVKERMGKFVSKDFDE